MRNTKTWGEVIDTMSYYLSSPKTRGEGTCTDVIISGSDMGIMQFPEEFITSCIDEIKRLEVKRMIGEPISQLEKLAIELLLYASHQGDLLQAKEQ
jgi:hypothetical protein